MTEWDEEYPSWGDVNRRVEVEMDDGRVVVGTLTAEEMYSDEDEWPVFGIELDDGTEVSFGDMKRWRHTPTPAPQ